MAVTSASERPAPWGFIAPVRRVILMLTGERRPSASRDGAWPTPASWHWAQRCLNRAAPSDAAGAWAKAAAPDSVVTATIAAPSMSPRAIR